MGVIASQITSLIVNSAVYSGADQSKHQSSASLAFVWGIHRGPVNSPHKWPVTRKMFPFDDVIMYIPDPNSLQMHRRHSQCWTQKYTYFFKYFIHWRFRLRFCCRSGDIIQDGERDLARYRGISNVVLSHRGLVLPCGVEGNWSSLVQVMAGACLAPSLYLKQYWLIVNWTIRNKLRWN